jgi:hypothetical protein
MTSLKDFREDEVYKNFPTAYPRISIFDNGLNDSDEIDELLDIANSVTKKKHTIDEKMNSWYKYNDDEVLDYAFSQLNIAKSRFTDGKIPIWYSSSTIQNSLDETTFHLERNVRFDLKQLYKMHPKTKKIEYVENERALAYAKIECQEISDKRDLKARLANYQSLDSYDECIKEAKICYHDGSDGIIYLSARSQSDVDCYAIWNKQAILTSVVKKFYTIVVYADSKKESLAVYLDEAS